MSNDHQAQVIGITCTSICILLQVEGNMLPLREAQAASHAISEWRLLHYYTGMFFILSIVRASYG